LTAVWSCIADRGADDSAFRRAGRSGAEPADAVRRFDTPRSRGARALIPAPPTAATEWERYVADLRRQLDEVDAKLCFAERWLEHDPAAGRAAVAAAPTPGDRVVSERSDAAARLVRDRWTAAARKLDDLKSAGSTPPVPVLNALGRERGVVQLPGGPIHLSRRHTEILVLLAVHPDGLTTEQLALALYGETGRPASARTELCRLRKTLGPWIQNERNRVKVQMEADFVDVQRLLRAGEPREAAERYTAPLLPNSEAPGIVQVREELDAWVRSAVMTSGDQEALWVWLENASGRDDVLAWKRFLAEIDFTDPRRPRAVSRLARLRDALTIAA
jgi:hypothetical protein